MPASFQISSAETGAPARLGEAPKTFNSSQPLWVVVSHDLGVCNPSLFSSVLSDVTQPRKDHGTVSGQVPSREGHVKSKRREPLPCSHKSFLLKSSFAVSLVALRDSAIMSYSPRKARTALAEDSWKLPLVSCSAQHAPCPVVSATCVGSTHLPRSTLGSKFSELSQTC